MPETCEDKHWKTPDREGRKDCRRKKPVRKEKKLETTEKSVDLTDAFRPKRISAPGGTFVRFRRNATGFRAERIR